MAPFNGVRESTAWLQRAGYRNGGKEGDYCPAPLAAQKASPFFRSDPLSLSLSFLAVLAHYRLGSFRKGLIFQRFLPAPLSTQGLFSSLLLLLLSTRRAEESPPETKLRSTLLAEPTSPKTLQQLSVAKKKLLNPEMAFFRTFLEVF